jgi:hypothetical protein
MRAEAENSLILGIADALARDASPTSEPPYLSTVEINGNVVACALRTPPHKLALTRCDHPQAMTMLATDALSIYPDLATALGPEPDVEVFAAAWSALTGRRVQRGMRQRLHEIRQLRSLRNPPPGELRPANAADFARRDAVDFRILRRNSWSHKRKPGRARESSAKERRAFLVG